jgi:hypothetical protein
MFLVLHRIHLWDWRSKRNGEEGGEDEQGTGPRGKGESGATRQGRGPGAVQADGAEVRAGRRAVVETALAGVTVRRARSRAARLAASVAFAIGAWMHGVAGPRAIGATSIIAKDFGQLCREADLVFVGTVVEVTSGWSDPAKQSIETRVVFSDLVPLFGVEASQVELRFGGGTMDGIREEIAGVPRFAVGERRVIFARKEHSVSPIVGFDQGAFTVVDSASGPVVLGSERRPVAAIADRTVELAPPSASLEAGLSLDAFLASVRERLAARAANP